MTASIAAPTRRAVVGNFLLSHLGMFSVLPMLALFLRDEGAGAALVGLTLGAYTLAQRASGLLTAAALERYREGRAAAVAMLAAAAGLVALALAGPTAAIPALVLVGVGVNANGLLVRSMLNVTHDGIERQRAYATVNVAVNVAAAVGPFLGLLLYGRLGGGPVFAAAAALYAAAGVGVLLAPPTPAHRPVRPSLVETWAELWRMARVPGTPRLLLVTAFGWLAYAQLYSALPLSMVDREASDTVVAVVFAVNAVVVAGTQTAVGRVMERAALRGWPHTRRLALGMLTFAVSFVLVAVLGAAPWAAVCAIVVFSLAETVFTPTVDVAFAELHSEHRLAAVNLRQVAHAAGETVGVLAGSTGYLLLTRASEPGTYWWIAAVAVGSVALVLLRTRRGASHATVDRATAAP